jgi:branched-subunit amino acid aminotransferase/4-amino-4-deoxychorismate lyase
MRRIVPVGIGSAKIYENGRIEITITDTGNHFGQELFELAKMRMLEGLLIIPDLYPAVEGFSEP